MKIKYEKGSVEKYFNDISLMNKKIGKDLTRGVKKRHNELAAANNFRIYLDTGLGKPHLLGGNLEGCYGINISRNVRLVVKPITESLDPASLEECDTVIIKGVLDYHGHKNEWLIP